MRSLIAAAGALWIAVIMWDAFEAIVLPRRVTRRLRPARMFYRVTWRIWSAVPRRMRPGGRRETFLSFYGPLSLLVLLAAWAASLVIAFAMVQVGIGTRLNVEGDGAFLDHLYMNAIGLLSQKLPHLRGTRMNVYQNFADSKSAA